MGKVIATMRVMPDRPDADLQAIQKKIKTIIEKHGEFARSETQPIAFGLKAVIVYFMVPDTSGGTSEIESLVSKIPNVQSVEVIDVRRAI